MNLTCSISRRTGVAVAFAALFVLLAVTFLPWLGLTDFNTKGEPREAIVALSMQMSGDYILPVSMGVDFPYKPPFLAWLIVASSWLTGGVNEIASRLPSAVAMIALAMGTAIYFYRRNGLFIGVLTALVMATSIEVWRAATACRVDMVLTACMVGGIMLMETRYRRRGVKGVSGWAVVLMSGAMLTKGPIGILLPCLVMMVYYLTRGERFRPSLLWLALSGLLAMVIPALWYVAAWKQGGQPFLDLVIEENFGRFLGRMSYDSHVNPWYYNVFTVVSGMLPYTLLALMSVFVVKYVRPARITIRGWRTRLAAMEPGELFALTVVAVIFIFYCIPKSKRSVYLLPIYPFLAWYVARLFVWLGSHHRRVVNIYGGIIGVISLFAGVALLSLPVLGNACAGLSAKAAALVSSLAEGMSAIWPVALTVVLLCAVVMLFRSMRRHVAPEKSIFAVVTTTMALLWCTSGIILPAVLNAKSDRPVALEIERMLPAGAPIYMYNPDRLLRYYTIGFYTNDRVRLFESTDREARGWLITGTRSIDELRGRHSEVEMETVVNTRHRSCDTRDTIAVIRFTPRSVQP